MKPLNILIVCAWYPTGPMRYLAEAFERLGHKTYRMGPTYNDQAGLDWGSDLPRVDFPFKRELPEWDLTFCLYSAQHHFRKFGESVDLAVFSEETYQTHIVPQNEVPSAVWSMDGWPNAYARSNIWGATAYFHNHPNGIRIHPVEKIPEPWQFLPTAAAPWLHKRLNQERDLDFVLHATLYGDRPKICNYLRSKHWRVADGWVKTEEYVRNYNRGWVTFHNACAQIECKYRLYEAMAMGCVNICDPNPLLERCGFKEWEHYIPIEAGPPNENNEPWPTGEMIHELMKHLDIDYHPKEVAEIAEMAYRLALDKDTYFHRALKILQGLGFHWHTDDVYAQYYGDGGILEQIQEGVY